MDLGSLEAELRPSDEDQHRVPDAYADLAEEYTPDEDTSQDDYQLRRSG